MRLVVGFLMRREFKGFCLNEYESICSLHGVETQFISDVTNFDPEICPFIEVDIPAEKVEEGFPQVLCERSVMIRCIIDPISQGDSHQALIDNIDKQKFDKFMQMKLPLKFRVEAANKKYTEEERDSIINLWGVFGYDDKVIDLKNPKQIYNVLGCPRTNQYYFGLELGYKNTKVSKDCCYSTKYDLKQRPYLGPTSTSHDLAFMMANQAEVKEGDLVYDPFVGTGSILVACTIMKAFCFGSDIDVRVLQGYSVGHKATKEIAGTDDIKRYDVYTNFKYYNLPKPLIVSMDISYLT